MQLILGFISAIVIAYLAYRAHTLKKSGAYAAAFTGTVIFGLGGWQWAILLLTFFITSSALSRAFKKRKQGLNEKYSKSHHRDSGQVFGNGGIAILFAATHFFFPASLWPWLGFAAALAAVNADTWATELGVLGPHSPRMITDLRRVVEKGTSGGISLTGILAALAGAGLIGMLASFLDPSTALRAGSQPASISTGLIVTLAGLAGSLFDSLLGATVQAIYFCPKHNKETEQHPIHTCGAPTTQIRGWSWLNNDWVNFGCGAFGVIMAILIGNGA